MWNLSSQGRMKNDVISALLVSVSAMRGEERKERGGTTAMMTTTRWRPNSELGDGQLESLLLLSLPLLDAAAATDSGERRTSSEMRVVSLRKFLPRGRAKESYYASGRRRESEEKEEKGEREKRGKRGGGGFLLSTLLSLAPRIRAVSSSPFFSFCFFFPQATLSHLQCVNRAPWAAPRTRRHGSPRPPPRRAGRARRHWRRRRKRSSSVRRMPLLPLSPPLLLLPLLRLVRPPQQQELVPPRSSPPCAAGSQGSSEGQLGAEQHQRRRAPASSLQMLILPSPPPTN